MLNNKYIQLILIIAVIVGLLIVLNASFGVHVGLGGKTASFGVQ